MKKISVALLLINLASSVSATELVSINAACVCDPKIVDKLENPQQIAFGTFSGKCVDSCKYRRSKFMQKEGRNPERIEFSNYKHKGRYWTAQIPVNAVQAADVGFEEFIPGIFHVFLVFEFPPAQPVHLRSQDGKGETDVVHTLAISPEGIPPKDEKYNFFDASMGRYITAVRLLSMDQIVDSSVRELKHSVNLYKLMKSKSEISDLLRVGLQHTESHSFSSVYDLLHNNCATNTMDWIDQVFRPDHVKDSFYTRWIYSFERAVPIAGPFSTLDTLISRNLIGEKPEVIK